MIAIQVGWALTPQKLLIKQGSSGSVQILATLTNDAGVPYDDWTCRVAVVSPFNDRVVIDLEPTVVGDAGAHTLTAVMEFVPDTTADLQPGVYSGDVRFSLDAARYFSTDVSLTIQASAP